MYKKIIACLDCKDGKLVKGVGFKNIKELADPVERAEYYIKEGIDEIVYYDITASTENRGNRLDVAKAIGKLCLENKIPFTIGGGIKSINDIEEAFEAGATKVSINTAAVINPELIKQAAEEFGSERIMIALDGRRNNKGSWNVYLKGGQENTGLDVINTAIGLEKLGAGEICMNSIDEDGLKGGYDLKLIEELSNKLNIPIIASGGAGTLEHFKEAFDAGASSALGASVFHFDELDVHDIKRFLIFKKINVDWSKYEL